MKHVLRLNFIAIGIPIVLGLLGCLNHNLFMTALLSTMITGGLQVLIAIIMLIRDYKNFHLYIYFAITILFFALWMLFGINDDWLWTMPPALAIYLTYIVIAAYKKQTI